MTASLYGVGEQSVWRYGIETVPGTPVTTTTAIPIEPGQPAPKFSPARAQVKVAMGSPNNSIAVVDRKGSGTWSIVMKVYPTLGSDFLAACGLTAAGLVPSQSMTLQVNSGGKSFIYAGCRCTKAVLSSSIDNDLQVTLSGIFTARPTDDVLMAAPEVAGEDPFTWVDLGAVTLLSTAVTAEDMESWTITVDMPTALGYGNSGVPLANIAKVSSFAVSGQVQLFFSDQNVSEWSAAVVANGLTGALSIPYTNGAHSLTLAIPYAKYSDVDLPMAVGALDMITLPILSFSPSLGNQLTLAAA